MKNLLVEFHSPRFLATRTYLLSEEDYDSYFYFARKAFLRDYEGDDLIKITISYTDIIMWEKEDPHELDV